MSATQAAADAALTAAFNANFKMALKHEVIVKILGSPHVRGWYAEYRAGIAAQSSLPAQWKEAGLTPDEWKGVEVARTARTGVRSAGQERLAAAAQTYKDACAAINAEITLGLAAHASPLVLAVEGGYEQLPLAAQARIEGREGAEAREAQLKAELAAARKGWVKLARDGKAPF
jgi:hypothetical protein